MPVNFLPGPSPVNPNSELATSNRRSQTDNELSNGIRLNENGVATATVEQDALIAVNPLTSATNGTNRIADDPVTLSTRTGASRSDLVYTLDQIQNARQANEALASSGGQSIDGRETEDLQALEPTRSNAREAVDNTGSNDLQTLIFNSSQIERSLNTEENSQNSGDDNGEAGFSEGNASARGEQAEDATLNEQSDLGESQVLEELS